VPFLHLMRYCERTNSVGRGVRFLRERYLDGGVVDSIEVRSIFLSAWRARLQIYSRFSLVGFRGCDHFLRPWKDGVVEACASLGGNRTLYRFTNKVERKQKNHEYIQPCFSELQSLWVSTHLSPLIEILLQPQTIPLQIRNVGHNQIRKRPKCKVAHLSLLITPVPVISRIPAWTEALICPVWWPVSISSASSATICISVWSASAASSSALVWWRSDTGEDLGATIYQFISILKCVSVDRTRNFLPSGCIHRHRSIDVIKSLVCQCLRDWHIIQHRLRSRRLE
jgi:hypothetical protein